MLAASNVTTEMATYGWLMAGAEVQRQTGRHAAPIFTPPTQVRCRDGRYATTGVPPRDPATFQAVLDVLDRHGLREEFHSTAVLEIGAALDAPINFGHAATDPMVAELMTTGRDVVWFLAEHLDAYEFFMETQSIGLATGIIYTPGEAMEDPHFVARGFPAEVDHPELGRADHLPRRAVPLHRDPVASHPRPIARRAPSRPRLTSPPPECWRSSECRRAGDPTCHTRVPRLAGWTRCARSAGSASPAAASSPTSMPAGWSS